jgi:ribosomal protein S15
VNGDLFCVHVSVRLMQRFLQLKQRFVLLVNQKEYRVHETDTGSPEVQIAVLTAEISALNEHLREQVLSLQYI